MVDKHKNNAPRLRQQVRRSAQTPGGNTRVTSTSDQRRGDTRDTPSDPRSDNVTPDLDVLEKRVLGAVRGAVTDVLKESNQHPELPYIDMDFAATDVSSKNSRPATSGETLLQSRYSDRSDNSVISPAIEKKPTISFIKLASTIMAGLITGLVIGVVFGIVPLPINTTSEPVKIGNDNIIDGAVVGLPNNSQSFRSLTDNTTLSREPPRLNNIQGSYLDQSNRQITSLSAKREPRSGIGKPSVESMPRQSEPKQNIKIDEKPKTATSAPTLLNEDEGTAQFPTSGATEIKVRRPLKETAKAEDAAKDVSPLALNKSALVGQVIVLRIKGGTIEIAGRLKEYDVTNYVVTLPNSRVLKLRADLYDCVSDNCNKSTN